MNNKIILLLLLCSFLPARAMEQSHSWKKKIAYWYTLCKTKLLKTSKTHDSDINSFDSEESDIYQDYAERGHPVIEHNCDYYVGGVVDDYSGELLHGIQKDKLVEIAPTATSFAVHASCPVHIVNKTGSIFVTGSENDYVVVIEKRLAEKGFENTVQASSKITSETYKPMLVCIAKNKKQFHKAFLDYHIKVPRGKKISLRTGYSFPIMVSKICASNIDASSSKGPITMDVWAPLIRAVSTYGAIECNRYELEDARMKVKKEVRDILLSYWNPTGFDTVSLPQEVRKQIAELVIAEEELPKCITLSSKEEITVKLPPESNGVVDIFPRNILYTNFHVVHAQEFDQKDHRSGSTIKFGKNVPNLNHLVLRNTSKNKNKKIKLLKQRAQ